jgi:hypothetical protein
MREKVSTEAIERFMKALGRTGKTNARIYFVGGVSAVLLGWRESTIEDQLYKYPAIDPKSFRRAVEKFVQNL